jgi:hypothetical protein
VLLNPLGRSNNAPFFSIPRGEDDVALGLPARVGKLLEGARKLDEDGRARVGISVAALT